MRQVPVFSRLSTGWLGRGARGFVAVACLLLLVVFSLACRSGPDAEGTGVDSCDSYIVAYSNCLRKTGMGTEQMATRLTAARASMTHTAGAGDAPRAALAAKCAQATKHMEESCR